MTELRHGYTLTDLHGLARLAVHTAGTAASDWHDRYDTAWSAIAEHLYAAEHWLPRHDFVRVGQLAIYATVDDDRHHHGYYKRKTIGAEAGAGSSPAFAAYWEPFTAPAPSPENRVVERLSLTQILPTLTPAQREAILALAACDDYAVAARAIGATGATFKSNVSRGRQRFLAWWHEGEVPSKPWGCDRRAGKTAGTRREGGAGAAVAAVRRRARARDLIGSTA
jgi:hypothetical protein